MNAYRPGNVLLMKKHKDKLVQKVTTWEANEPMIHVHPSFMCTDTRVHMPRIHPLNHPHRVDIRTPRNTFNLVHSCSWMCKRICGLLNLIHASGKSKKKTWLVFGNDVQFHFPNFPEVLLCCHYSHPKVQMSPRPSQHSTDSFCSPGWRASAWL